MGRCVTLAEGRPTISASKETHLQLPPDCLVKGCNRTFEGQVPDDWLETEFSFVATRYDGAHCPVELLPMKVGVFFCPEHAAQMAQIKDLGDVIEPTPEGGFTICLDDD